MGAEKGKVAVKHCLLDELAGITGCIYLSDLRQKMREKRFLLILEQIVPEEYTIEDWNDTVHYLCGRKVEFQKKEDALACLCDFVREFW
ncbi:hypothetical protein [Bacilliculturomica massiliensis]|uniref:hypothetical protein n=1 Tax=Bacilliculturomica massiliensis TaxID=1917867 RepID=UPI0010309441|nr:hypothetical protein [Bacilliculturomica massiliensis]